MLTTSAVPQSATHSAGDASHLRQIKLLHTAIWVVMASAILALPVTAIFHQFRWSVGLSILVWCECLVLALNRVRCPLTSVAARYTNDRADNFDIYLPLWLARYNKQIFGTLFVIGEIILLWQWLRRPAL